MKKVLSPVIVLFVVCLCVTFILASVNMLTADTIAKTEAAALHEAAKSVLPQAVSLTPITEEGINGYVGLDEEGNIVGYTFTNASRGYGGNVTAVVGIALNGEITGVSVTAPDETPGLGANVKKDTFLAQFLGKAEGKFVLGQNVEAVTSATYSSAAVTAAVNMAKEQFDLLVAQSYGG